MCANLINETTFKDSDLLNLHVTICIVDNQLDKQSEKHCMSNCEQYLMYEQLLKFSSFVKIRISNP